MLQLRRQQLQKLVEVSGQLARGVRIGGGADPGAGWRNHADVPSGVVDASMATAPTTNSIGETSNRMIRRSPSDV